MKPWRFDSRSLVRRRGAGLRKLAGIGVMLSLLLPVAWAQSPPLPVDRFVLAYGKTHPRLPALETLADCEVRLARRDGVFEAAPPGQGELHRIGEPFPEGRFSESALIAIFQRLVAACNERGIFGVFVVPSRDEIDPQTREDFRPAGDRRLTLVIWASQIGELRSIAKGSRIPTERGIDNRKHRAIVRHSPLKAANGAQPGSLLEKRKLDAYLQRLNRLPGRRVEAAVSSTSDPGSVVLDYLVNEKRAWFAYGQVSNTGTDATSPWRERLGFTYNQLTDFDDVLALDYITSSITGGNAGFLSYDRPLIFPDVLRVKALGSYGEFTARDVGISLEEFTGTSWTAGLEATWSPWRIWDTAIDFTVGGAWQNVMVTNRTIDLKGDASLFTPYASIKLERFTETMQTALSVGWETNLADVAGTTPDAIFGLGRLDSDTSYNLLKFEFSHSMYIEPFLFRRDFREGRNWRRSTRAHELFFSVRGQQVLDGKRLIPQKQLAIGGMFSVRGYPESISGGDNVAYGTAEYRFHIPRAFRPYAASGASPGGRAPNPPSYFGRPFYWRPAQVYALPDWDLLFRMFADAGYTGIVRPRPEETDRTLVAVGAGLELQAYGTLSLRVDWGVALERVKTGNEDVHPGSSRIHVMASFMW